jgi:hypothetical protein
MLGGFHLKSQSSPPMHIQPLAGGNTRSSYRPEARRFVPLERSLL